jgi:hypothetical protein
LRPARTKFAVFPGTRGDGPVATLGVSLLSAPLRSDPLGLSNPAQRTPSKSAPSQSAIHTEVNGHRHKVKLTWTDTRLKRGGTWQVVAAHDMPSEMKYPSPEPPRRR